MPSNQYQQEESIYNLIPQEKVIPPKPPRLPIKFLIILYALMIKVGNFEGMNPNSKKQLKKK